MRRLTIIVAGADPERFRAVLAVAAAQAALERPARLFLQGDAVPLLRRPIASADDERMRAGGLPTLAQALEETLALGATIIACQSGLALAAMSAAELPDGVEAGGLVGLMADVGDDQLVIV